MTSDSRAINPNGAEGCLRELANRLCLKSLPAIAISRRREHRFARFEFRAASVQIFQNHVVDCFADFNAGGFAFPTLTPNTQINLAVAFFKIGSVKANDFD